MSLLEGERPKLRVIKGTYNPLCREEVILTPLAVVAEQFERDERGIKVAEASGEYNAARDIKNMSARRLANSGLIDELIRHIESDVNNNPEFTGIDLLREPNIVLFEERKSS